MKPAKQPVLIALILTLFPALFSAQPKADRRSASPRDFADLVASTELSERNAELAKQLIDELGPLLKRIPIEKIDRLEERGYYLDLVLRDDEPCKIKIPSQRRFIYDLRCKKLKKVKIDGAKLRLAGRIRFSLQHGEVRLRKGDVAVHHWLAGWTDLDVWTESRSEAIVCDDRDRPFVLQDAKGRPIRDDAGRYRLLRTERWLILKAGSRGIESPLPLDF